VFSCALDLPAAMPVDASRLARAVLVLGEGEAAVAAGVAGVAVLRAADAPLFTPP
jgi:hypothetical protein